MAIALDANSASRVCRPDAGSTPVSPDNAGPRVVPWHDRGVSVAASSPSAVACQGPASNTTTWAVALFVALGAFLRLYAFWRPGLWADEYGTWWVVGSGGGWSAVVDRALHIQGQSPLYYLIVKLFTEVLGTGTFALRLPSILFGIATVALAYPLGVAVFGQRRAGLVAAAAFAVSAPLIWYAQEARPYALALLCTVLSFLCYLRAAAPGALAWRAGYVLATAGVFYAHYVFAFVVVIQVAHLTVAHGRAWLAARPWPLTLLTLGLLWLPALPQLVHLFERRAILDWVPPVTWFVVLHVVIAYLDLPLLIVLGVCIAVIGPSADWRERLSARAPLGLLVLWFALPVVMFAGAKVLLGVTLLFDRYVLFILPAGLLVAVAVAGLGRRDGWRGLAPLAVLLIFSAGWNFVPSLQRTGGFGDRYDDDWAGAVASLERVARPGDVVLYGSGFVEADQLPQPDPDPRLLSFIRAPLSANLREDDRYVVLGLPFRVNEATRPYLGSVLARAAGGRRVHIIGRGEAVPVAAKALIASWAFTAKTVTRHGLVSVIVLEQNGR